ncbi:hypothetical protein Airi01_028840 [Actinoallomurus iriomotensis]|uniref:Uncharacterized protein n=1 Tax=Actinoallomurus iriomotensis TaxID=478107 RepID=A0A9W6VPM8_9ACTN|nr:hypothetical protein Airi01_028840 [Actinoallomurus iriomotensis]
MPPAGTLRPGDEAQGELCENAQETRLSSVNAVPVACPSARTITVATVAHGKNGGRCSSAVTQVINNQWYRLPKLTVQESIVTVSKHRSTDTTPSATNGAPHGMAARCLRQQR